MTVHAFVDESSRNGQYLLGVTIVEPAQRRRFLIDRIVTMNVSARLYTGACTRKTEEEARQLCLTQVARDLLGLQAHRLVLDTREDRDVRDRKTIQQVLGFRPSKTELTYEHVDSTTEPLLWISDAVAWCFGAGGDWRRRAMGLIAEHIEV